MAGLYSLLEHHSAHKFIDLSIRDFAIDASHVNWVATANTLDSIPAPILSRFIVLQIPAPNEQQLRQIALNLYQRLRNENLWGASFAQELDENVTKSLTEQSPRYIRAALKRAFGAAARTGRDNITPEDLPIIKGSKHRGIGFLATFEEQGMTCTSDPP
ncbi:Lon protease [compost metagenome]